MGERKGSARHDTEAGGRKKGGGKTKPPAGGFREVSERLDPHRENLVIGETQFEFCMAVRMPQFNSKIVAILSLDHNG
jgi:hypothetical protein